LDVDLWELEALICDFVYFNRGYCLGDSCSQLLGVGEVRLDPVGVASENLVSCLLRPEGVHNG
jgi:hypothetical protein